MTVEKGIDVNLRKTYLKNITGKKYSCDTVLEITDAHICLVNILLFDFLHCLGVFCFENDERSLNIRKTLEHINDPSVVSEIKRMWDNNDFSCYKTVVDDYTKFFHEDRTDKDFDRTLKRINSNAVKIYDAEKYGFIKRIRDKVTAHYEIDKSNNTVKLTGLNNMSDGINIINEAFELCEIVTETVFDIYTILTGGEYKKDEVFKYQNDLGNILSGLFKLT